MQQPGARLEEIAHAYRRTRGTLFSPGIGQRIDRKSSSPAASGRESFRPVRPIRWSSSRDRRRAAEIDGRCRHHRAGAFGAGPAADLCPAPTAWRWPARPTTIWRRRSPAIRPLCRLRQPADAKPGRHSGELRRAVKELGFLGAMVNGTTEGRFLDHPSYDGLLAAAVELDVPIYIHPHIPPEPVRQAYFSELPEGAAPRAGNRRLGLALGDRRASAAHGGRRHARQASQAQNSSSAIWARCCR